MYGRMNSTGGNARVAREWAAQSRAERRGSNFYFEGPALYSYGRHFVVARIATNKRGQTAAVFNPARYSVSTSRHQSYARHAWQGDVLHADPSARPKDGLATMRAEIAEAYSALARKRPGRSREWALETLADKVANARQYAKFHGLRSKVTMPDCTEEAFAVERARQKRLAVILAKRAARAKRDAEAAAAVRAANMGLMFDAWRAGAKNQHELDHTNRPAAARLHSLDPLVFESSRGSRVTVTTKELEAMRAFLNDPTAPAFPIDGLVVCHSEVFDGMPGQVRIGCTVFDRAELLRVIALVPA